METPQAHRPVLLTEVLQVLNPEPGDRALDVTLGLGGHAKSILEKTSPGGVLVGIDADLDNLNLARENLREFHDRVRFVHGNFRTLGDLSEEKFAVIFADLGVSSPHFDDPERGFSFRADGPLDMRLNRTSGRTAATLIEDVSEEELAKIFSTLGELPKARILAHAVKTARPKTTFALKAIAEEIYTYKAAALLPQVFQALRMALNHELESLESLLKTAPKLLLPGGRLAVLTFHSLEDRMVKNAFRDRTTPVKDDVTGAVKEAAPFKEIAKGGVAPSETELRDNPRSRSARLRAVQLLPSS